MAPPCTRRRSDNLQSLRIECRGERVGQARLHPEATPSGRNVPRLPVGLVRSRYIGGTCRTPNIPARRGRATFAPTAGPGAAGLGRFGLPGRRSASTPGPGTGRGTGAAAAGRANRHQPEHSSVQ
jgi:hypothetical protein